MTEDDYLSVLNSISDAFANKEEAAKNAYSNGRITTEQQLALEQANRIPAELLALLARVLSNIERLTIAQEVLAGIRNKPVLNTPAK